MRIREQPVRLFQQNDIVLTLPASLICDVLLNVLSSVPMMASVMLGITLGFNLMEESGYLARVSFLFDRTMSKADLKGKAIMPFCMGLGCTVAGTTGPRVVDNWGAARACHCNELGRVLRRQPFGGSCHCHRPFRQRWRLSDDGIDLPVHVF